MKKLMLLLLLFIPSLLYAGEAVTLPYDVVVADPLTDKAEKMAITIRYSGSGNHYAVLEYRILNQDQTNILYKYSFAIRDIPDNPESITANCTDVGIPWNLCTGVGTCTDDCDESTTDFTDFLSGFASTLNTRAEAAMSQDLQSKQTTQAKP